MFCRSMHSCSKPSEPSLYPVFDRCPSGRGAAEGFFGNFFASGGMPERVYEVRFLWWRGKLPVGEILSSGGMAEAC